MQSNRKLRRPAAIVAKLRQTDYAVPLGTAIAEVPALLQPPAHLAGAGQGDSSGLRGSVSGDASALVRSARLLCSTAVHSWGNDRALILIMVGDESAPPRPPQTGGMALSLITMPGRGSRIPNVFCNDPRRRVALVGCHA